MNDIELNNMLDKISIRTFTVDNEKVIYVTYKGKRLYTIYQQDGTIYTDLSDENENSLDIPQWVFTLRDLFLK